MTLTGGNGIQLISVYREVVPSGEYAMNYFTWLMHNLLPGLAWTLLGVFCILKFIKLGNGRCFNAREELLARKEEMGKMSVREWAVVIVRSFWSWITFCSQLWSGPVSGGSLLRAVLLPAEGGHHVSG